MLHKNRNSTSHPFVQGFQLYRTSENQTSPSFLSILKREDDRWERTENTKKKSNCSETSILNLQSPNASIWATGHGGIEKMSTKKTRATRPRPGRRTLGRDEENLKQRGGGEGPTRTEPSLVHARSAARLCAAMTGSACLRRSLPASRSHASRPSSHARLSGSKPWWRRKGARSLGGAARSSA